MAQTTMSSRQWALSLFQVVDKTFIGAGNELTFYIPPLSYLEEIKITVGAVFDGTGTVTVTATDGTTVFVNAQSVKALGAATVAVSEKYFPSGATITISLADANANSTVGTLYVRARYLGKNRETEVQN